MKRDFDFLADLSNNVYKDVDVNITQNLSDNGFNDNLSNNWVSDDDGKEAGIWESSRMRLSFISAVYTFIFSFYHYFAILSLIFQVHLVHDVLMFQEH